VEAGAGLEDTTPVAVYCGGPTPCLPLLPQGQACPRERGELNPDKSGSKNWYAETCIPYGLALCNSIAERMLSPIVIERDPFDWAQACPERS